MTHDEPAAKAPPASARSWVEITALAAIVIAGLAAWGTGIFTRGYDYDEVLRAHSIWLTSKGLRPYTDFFEVHPPYFVLLSPVFRAFTDPVHALIALRFVAAAGNLLFLGGLVLLGRFSLPPDERMVWSWLAVAVVAFRAEVLAFLVEFRIDGWGYGLIALLVYWYCRRPRTARGILTFGALTGIVSALFAPKMVLLAPLVVLADQMVNFASWRGFLRAGAAYAVGVGLAGAAFLGYLIANGIGLERTSLMLGRYHAISNAHAGFGYGLVRVLLLVRPLLALVCGGALVWAARCLRRRAACSTYPPALLVWLLLQAALVAYPYKQYYAPWLLFASGLVPPLGAWLGGLFRGARPLLFVIAAALSVHGAYKTARAWYAAPIAESDNYVIRWMNRVTTPQDRVVAYPPYHPIDRYDTFFLALNTTDPSGFDSERIFAELPALRQFATPERYRAELEAHPPALVVVSSPVSKVSYPSAQGTALESYLLAHGYRSVRVGFVMMAIRPDCHDRAAEKGFLPSPTDPVIRK